MSLLEDTCSQLHLQLELLLILVALKVSGRVLPIQEELGGPGSARAPQWDAETRVSHHWELGVVEHPKQEAGGIIWNKRDLEQLVSLMACPRSLVKPNKN